MATLDVDQYFTYEGRLASFRKTTKKRGSNASGRGGSKALNWPHKQITPASLAKAGFYFNPSPDSPDNCLCFLCEKGLDGWEAGDDPLHEHLTHSSSCGWAILTAIELEIQEYALQDPTLPHMVEARKATFAGKWPHDGKKGWQCKTKQLVDAGWMYTPTAESDDMATCTYCQLALDGWEPSDKPYEEHFKRSPNCAFFTIERTTQPATKKSGRGKNSRTSKASRLSTQSVQSVATTAASEISTIDDATAEPQDSILTTTSTMTQGKKTKGKKAAAKTAKGGRKKAKKDDASVADETEDDNTAAPEAPPAKSTRGRKRGSEAVEDSVISTASAPATKKRATKTRGSVATESSTVSEDTAVPEPKKATTKKGRPSKTRQASAASNISLMSVQEQHEEFPDDDEIERQLEADLERQLTEDEFVYEYRHAAPKSSPEQQRKVSKPKSAAYAMFNPTPSEAGESEIEEELNGLQNEMEVDEPNEIHVPKKGRKATTTRKASKQTKAKKVKEPTPSPSPSPSPSPEPAQQLYETDDAVTEDNESIASDDTVVKNDTTVHSSPGDGARKGNRKASVSSEDSVDMVTYVEPDDTPVKRGRKAKVVEESRESTEEPEAQTEAEYEEEVDNEEEAEADVDDDEVHIAEDPVETSPVRDDSHLTEAEPPSTPGHDTSPAQSAKQPVVSPSPSPQSSDAENQPPSSRPSASASTKRIALAPLAETPSRMSPSKRNVMAGLQSTTPWTAVNLEAIFGTPRGKADKENGVERFLKQGKDLSSPEKQMTVEEWIYFNAGEAEKKLKYECEKMVGVFEGEGTRAMNVLEGLSVD